MVYRACSGFHDGVHTVLQGLRTIRTGCTGCVPELTFHPATFQCAACTYTVYFVFSTQSIKTTQWPYTMFRIHTRSTTVHGDVIWCTLCQQDVHTISTGSGKIIFFYKRLCTPTSVTWTENSRLRPGTHGCTGCTCLHVVHSVPTQLRGYSHN